MYCFKSCYALECSYVDYMTTTQNKPADCELDAEIAKLCSDYQRCFKTTTRQYAFFHIAFFLIATIELCILVLFFTFLTKPSVIAFTLAGIFLTTFSYFMLHFYFQAKKPQQIQDLHKQFIQDCIHRISFSHQLAEYHLFLSQALHIFLDAFSHQESQYYSLTCNLSTITSLVEKFSIWMHWKDVYLMREKILLSIVEQHIEYVKLYPTDLQAHAGLGKAYLELANLYCHPNKVLEKRLLWISPEYDSEEMQDKFSKACYRAIEEFHILDAYSPEDPWVHAQLAGIYHSLDQPLKEIEHYEKVLSVVTEEKQILLRLGTLYFQNGASAKGLQMYEKLKKISEKAAEELLSQYGSFSL
jgi:hypothetical protein